MSRSSRKLLASALAGITFVSLVSLSCHADDLVSSAVSRIRERGQADRFKVDFTSADSPQRMFQQGVTTLREGKSEEALPLLADAERKLPLLGDYAAYYQAEALYKLKRYAEAGAKALALTREYPSSLLIRRALKLQLDSAAAGELYSEALRLSQTFIEKYPSGSDSVDALYLSGVGREKTGDAAGAVPIYRSIWLNSPRAAQAEKSRERLAELAKQVNGADSFTPAELLRRASALFARNAYAQCLQTLRSIPLEGQPVAVVDHVVLRSGLCLYRMRNWSEAEKNLLRVTASGNAAVRSEARFWLAKVLEHTGKDEQAFALFMELAGEGQLADDALMEAAGLRKGMGRYGESALLFEKVAQGWPESKHHKRAGWESGWCRYLGGEYDKAAVSFKSLLDDESQREKALYWLGRVLEGSGSSEAADYFSMLLNEYPAGFYATWYREQKGIKDNREALAQRSAVIDAPLPAGYEKPLLLASLGMAAEARREASARWKSSDRKGKFPALARLYLEMGDYGSAISLFLGNRSIAWEKESLTLWTAGYPLAYAGPVARETTVNSIPESLIYAIIRAESRFTPAVKSPAGAIGLMQLMPSTAKATSHEKGNFNPARLTVPDYNIMLGTRHFRGLLNSYDGDVVYSVAAYNAGSGAVQRWRKRLAGLKKDEFIESIPYRETRDYVKKVYAAAATYRQLYGLR